MIKKKYKIKKLELWVGVNVGEIGEIWPPTKLIKKC